MIFQYSKYIRGCFFVPLLVFIFFSFYLISVLIPFFTQLKKSTLTPQKIQQYLVGFLVGAFFLTMNGGRLLNGGIFLMFEKESDAIVVEGQISQINELGIFSFPELSSDYGNGDSNGVEIVINGVGYAVPVCGDLQVGDEVVLTVLPKSKYILEIRKTGTGSPS